MDWTYTLEVKNLTKDYGANKTALEDVTLSVDRGEILCLLGPSGSGKTTLLRIIAGLEDATHGDVFINGEHRRGVPPKDRDVGFVFQTTQAVFPHMTVYQNIAFPLGLRTHKHRNRDIVAAVHEMLELVRMTPFSSHYPESLSGGERQRVAIARALIYRPSLLLLDEPLSSLDNILKRELIEIILNLRSQFQPTIVYVTHDEREALELADKIVILDDGQKLQEGVPREVLEKPNSRKVAEIIGGWNVNTVPYSKLESVVELTIGDSRIRLNYDESVDGGEATPDDIEIGIPTSAIRIADEMADRAEDLNLVSIAGYVQRVTSGQGYHRVYVNCGRERLRVDIDSQPSWLRVNSRVYLNFDRSCIRLWPKR